MRTSTVWPGAEVSDSSTFDHWFGIIAFYVTTVAAAVAAMLAVLAWAWLIRKLWRMKYRNEGWWD